MKLILPIVSSFSGGVLVGGAFAAFITLIKVFPRLIQFTETKKYLIYYEIVFTISTIIFTIIYFSNFSWNLGKLAVVFIGIFFGLFLGMFSSALAETLNVMPVIANKFKLSNSIKYVFASLVLGKVCGAIYYFIFF